MGPTERLGEVRTLWGLPLQPFHRAPSWGSAAGACEGLALLCPEGARLPLAASLGVSVQCLPRWGCCGGRGRLWGPGLDSRFWLEPSTSRLEPHSVDRLSAVVPFSSLPW